jgi:hypothetical protein
MKDNGGIHFLRHADDLLYDRDGRPHDDGSE